MPPTCSPKKITDAQVLTNNSQQNDYGYLTPPTTSRDNTENDKNTIKNLLEKVPEVDKLFKVHQQIGEGTFSSVFMATLRLDPTKQKRFALKHLIPTCHPDRIKLELQCLQDLGGKDNICAVELCLRHKDNVVFVMPYMRHDQFSHFVSCMDSKELAFYMKNLMIALARVHSFDIIHRDIKPSNFLYDRVNKRFMLVDFGLAQAAPAAKEAPLKRKREQSPEGVADAVKQLPKQQKKSTAVLHKENTSAAKGFALKSPFKSPLKSNSSNILFPKKSPFKFPGLDLPKNHSTISPKTDGKRRLFQDASSKNDPATATVTTQQAQQLLQQKKSPKGIIFTTSLTPKVCNESTSNKDSAQQHRHKPNRPRCSCYGKAAVCSVCVARRGIQAPRAGTPGFRPPEVLLKSVDQNTGVDVWAAGVVMLCVMSGTYPFFQGSDDVACLAELVTMFGDTAMKRLAHQLGRHFMCSEKRQPLDLRKVCSLLRAKDYVRNVKGTASCANCMQFKEICLCQNVPIKGVPDIFPEDAYKLLHRCLDVNPATRITAAEALQHPYLKDAFL